MIEYYVGDRLIREDDDHPAKGIPVIDVDGSEILVLPDEFDSLGRPEADAAHWQPQLEEGETNGNNN